MLDEWLKGATENRIGASVDTVEAEQMVERRHSSLANCDLRDDLRGIDGILKDN